MIEIPYAALQVETLDALIEEFVTRDGTDYGESEVPLSSKVVQVKTQLERGTIKIVYDEQSESCNIVPSE